MALNRRDFLKAAFGIGVVAVVPALAPAREPRVELSYLMIGTNDIPKYGKSLPTTRRLWLMEDAMHVHRLSRGVLTVS